ncbi:enoyl-[acyl-carrier-protein] reductase FabK [Vallitalea guaymasensis]|uniref:enoyl-[acyl-carrier-protein] reductase FabK n=1 Tax=Vallitalea guaymasensis TaxID=1185412 RepID=UPI002ED54CAC
MESEICKMLNIEYPIFQGAMAWIAEYNLVAAVSNAGGLGIIAGGNAPCDVVREQIRKTKELTDKPFGVNIMLLSPFADEIAHMVCEEKVAVVTTGAGNPGKYLEMWKENDIKVIPVVPSVALAKRMERSGVDAIIAEGCESGGHVGELTTMALLPQVVDAVDIPVIAAGGIGDGRGIAATKMLGADAFQIGTRFLVAKECVVHKNYKEKILKAKDIDTRVTGKATGHPVRALKNKFTRKFLQLEKEGVSVDDLEEFGTGKLRLAVVDGDVANGSVMSGQIAGMIKKEQTCSEIIKELVIDADKVIDNIRN